jgi:DNA-binding transcriptional LysR family regulator
VDEAERAVAGEYAAPRGDLVVTAPIVFGRLHVLPIVNDFLARYPEISVRLALSDRNADLIDDHIDVAVRIGRLPESAAVATRMGSVRRVVCGSPAYFQRRGEPKTPIDLSAHDCVTFEGLGGANAWDFPVPGSKTMRVVPIRSRLSVSTAEAAIEAASAGVGVTRLLSYQAAGAIAAGALKVVLEDFEGEAVPVHLLHAGQGLLPLTTRAFLDAAAPRLRRVLRAPSAP